MSGTEMDALIKLVWLAEIGSLRLGKENRKALHKQRKMALAEQKNRSCMRWPDSFGTISTQMCLVHTLCTPLFTVLQISKKISLCVTLRKKVEGLKYFCGFKHMGYVIFQAYQAVFSLYPLCFCRYCVCFTHGLPSTYLLLLRLAYPPFFSHIISMYSHRSWLKGFLVGWGEKRRRWGDGRKEEWSLLPHMSGQERVEWRSSSS